MTFSIAARCEKTGMFGVAIASSSPAVAARCAYARAGAGAVATQNITDPRLGPAGLALLGEGRSADQVIAALKQQAGDSIEYRQITAVDRDGGTSAFSGERALGVYGHFTAPNAVAAGNMLATPGLPRHMVESFSQSSERHLGDRLLSAMRAALAVGGEEGPIHSAGLLLVDEVSWPVADLRIDWSDDPLGELTDLWGLWQPQMADYVTRGLDPTRAPTYGVPGDP